jgi:parallel beta-helix repeat protein
MMTTHIGFFILLLLTYFASMSPIGANAATYYVAKRGSNNYSCSEARSASKAKLTIAAGLSCLARGDTLSISGGIYLEAINGKQVPSGISNSQRTIIKSSPGETVILAPKTGGSAGDVIQIAGHSYVTYYGLIVDGSNVTNHGVRIQTFNKTAAHNITLQNMEIKNAAKNCIFVQNDNRYIRLLDSKIHNCGGSPFDHGIYFRGSYGLIDGNEIYENSGHGVHQYHSGCDACSNNVVSYNNVHGNVSRGILIGSGDNNIAHHNVSSNNGGDGISVGFGSTRDNKVYNNTISNNRDVCIEIRSSSSNSVVKNNLCINNSRNIIANMGSASIISSNNLAANTQLMTDALIELLTPHDTSTLIDAGEYIPGFSDGKFLGTAPDQGAIEYGAQLDYSLNPVYEPDHAR